jgi:hypothetical protein
MNPKQDQFIPVGRQPAIEVNGDVITPVNIDFKAISPQRLRHLVDESRVRLQAMQLVNYSCPELAGAGWNGRLVPGQDEDQADDHYDAQANSQPS